MTKTVKMSKKSFIAEHKELVKVLKKPTKAKIKKELKEQSEELSKISKRK